MNLPTALLPEAVARNEAIRRSRNVVDGEIRNTEPATGKPLPPVRVTPADEVRDTVRRAREAQVRWAGLSWAEREKRLLAYRALLVERARDVYEVLMREVGKPKFEALTHEVYPVADLDKAKKVYKPIVISGMEKGLVALYQRCVHLGCRVPFCDSSQWFECPCHGSKYNRVGEKQGGPAPRGLDRFALEVSGGNIVVDTGNQVTGPPIGTNTTGQSPEGAPCV
jgi:Rieske Fe-S protein